MITESESKALENANFARLVRDVEALDRELAETSPALAAETLANLCSCFSASCGRVSHLCTKFSLIVRADGVPEDAIQFQCEDYLKACTDLVGVVQVMRGMVGTTMIQDYEEHAHRILMAVKSTVLGAALPADHPAKQQHAVRAGLVWQFVEEADKAPKTNSVAVKRRLLQSSVNIKRTIDDLQATLEDSGGGVEFGWDDDDDEAGEGGAGEGKHEEMTDVERAAINGGCEVLQGLRPVLKTISDATSKHCEVAPNTAVDIALVAVVTGVGEVDKHVLRLGEALEPEQVQEELQHIYSDLRGSLEALLPLAQDTEGDHPMKALRDLIPAAARATLGQLITAACDQIHALEGRS